MAATLNIAALARRTGVQPDTIRKWEQRYGVLHPERTRGGQRRYSELDVSRFEWLKARLEEGYRIGEAAAILDQGEPPTGTLAEQRVGFTQAIHAGDGERIGQILEHTLRTAALEEVVDELLEPVLRELGERWVAGESLIAHEHLVTHAIRAHIGSHVADARCGLRGTAVLASGTATATISACSCSRCSCTATAGRCASSVPRSRSPTRSHSRGRPKRSF